MPVQMVQGAKVPQGYVFCINRCPLSGSAQTLASTSLPVQSPTLVSYNLRRHLPDAVSSAGFTGGRREMIYRRKMGVIKTTGLLYPRLSTLGFIPTTLLSSGDK